MRACGCAEVSTSFAKVWGCSSLDVVVACEELIRLAMREVQRACEYRMAAVAASAEPWAETEDVAVMTVSGGPGAYDADLVVEEVLL